VRNRLPDTRGATRGFLHEWRQILDGKLALQGAASLSDQVLISGTHFAVGILLARHAGASDYGAYVLAFSTMLLFAGIQGALITTPMTILAAPLEGTELRGYVTTLALGQVGLGALCAAAALAFMAVAALLAPESRLAPALLGLSVALPFVHTQELLRRILFMRLLPGRVLANDLVNCGIQLTLVVIFLRLDRPFAGTPVWLTPRNVFLATAAASLAATLLGVWQIRSLLTRRYREVAVEAVRKTWSLARWGLGTQAGHALMLQANRFIAAAFAGTAGVALLEAPRLLVAPLQTISQGAGNLTFPRAARHFAEGGTTGMLRFLRPVSLLWAVSFITYSAVLAVAPAFWIRLAYSGKYEGGTSILLIWCAANAVMGLRVLPSTALRVMRRLDLTMVSNLVAGGCVVATSLMLCALMGPAGAAIAKAVGEVVLLVALLAFLRRELRAGGSDTSRFRTTAGTEVEE